MAKFRLTTPDGAVYSVDAPDEQSAIAALGSLSGAAGPQQAEQPQFDPPPRIAREAGTEPEQMRAVRDEIERDKFNSLPWYKQAAQAAQDVGQLAAQGATFGWGDEIAGRLNSITQGVPYEQAVAAERERTADARARAGLAAIPAEMIGGVATGGAIARGGGSAMGRLAPRGAIGSATGAAIDGAALGAVHGAGSADDGDRLSGALAGGALGAGIGAAGSGVASGLSKIAGAFKPKANVPDTASLWQKAEQAYEAADQAGVILRPESVSRLQKGMEKALADFGWAPEITPGVAGVLKNLERMSGENVTLKGLDTLRKTAGQLRAMKMDPTAQAVGGKLVQEIDDFLASVKPGDVLAGDARQGVQSLMQARESWKRASKAEKIETAITEAADRAAKTGSGGNLNNTTRQEIDKAMKRGRWTPDEREALERVTKQGAIGDALRLAGKASPEGNGLSMMLHLGAAGASGGTSLPIAALGAAAKRLADNRTVTRANEALRLIQSGGNASALAAPPSAFDQFLVNPALRLGVTGGLVDATPVPELAPYFRQ